VDVSKYRNIVSTSVYRIYACIVSYRIVIVSTVYFLVIHSTFSQFYSASYPQRELELQITKKEYTSSIPLRFVACALRCVAYGNMHGRRTHSSWGPGHILPHFLHRGSQGVHKNS